jgi:hypothetical protein
MQVRINSFDASSEAGGQQSEETMSLATRLLLLTFATACFLLGWWPWNVLLIACLFVPKRAGRTLA